MIDLLHPRFSNATLALVILHSRKVHIVDTFNMLAIIECGQT